MNTVLSKKAIMKNRRSVISAIAGGGVAVGLPTLMVPSVADAQSTKIVCGFTAVTDFTSAFVAKEEGYFSKRGLDVELKFIPLNSTIPAAIQSDSLQVGGPTPSVFLQGIDGGLDHVVIAGAAVTSKSITAIGLVARAGSGIKTAQDCVGKKIGVPGLGAFLHVTFRAWLKKAGVDYKKVTFIEASFPQHGDLLRGGSIDAVVTGDPFMSRILDSSIGYVAAYYTTFLEEGNPTIVYTAKREWVQKNPLAAKGFRDALVEAAVFMSKPANDLKMREHIGKFIKLPPEIIAKVQLSPPVPLVTEKQLNFWVAMMKDQEMLKASPAIATLIAK
jgi:NitT/TauT family transport system substrate-binding protein